jgi:ABC-type uncharacterized transport system substrate-binding protein
MALPFFLSASGANHLDRCCLAWGADPQTPLGKLTCRWSIRSRFLKSMKKIFISFVLVAMLLALCVSAEAQQPKKIARIGYLSNTEPGRESARAEAIRLALRERGYIEGQNIAIEYRYAELKLDRLPELASELVHLKVDIIVAAGGTATVRAAKNATNNSHRYDRWWG